MTTEDIAHFIGIGFCQPKFYKPHIWRKARLIMEWLCQNTGHVERFSFGPGKGKYRLKLDSQLDNKDFWKEAIPQLAWIYWTHNAGKNPRAKTV